MFVIYDYNANKQVDVNTFESKGRIVNKEGGLLSADCKDLYQIISKEKQSFASLDSPATEHKETTIYYIKPIHLSEKERLLLIQIDENFSKFVNKKDQKTLIDAVKLAAQRNGRETSKFIRNYGIISEKDRFEIAKLAAQQDGEGTSEFIENYGIISEKDRFEIAKLAAQQDGEGTSEFIENYGIISEKDRFEIAKLAAQQDGIGASEFIERYKITSEEDRSKIAMAAIWRNRRGRTAAEYIKNYKIMDQKLLFEIAKIFAKRDGKGTSEFIEDFGIISEKDRARIAMIAAQKNGAGASKYIKNYKIMDQKRLFAIAKIVAEQDGTRISEYIEDFGIISEKDRARIAMIAVQKNGAGTAEHIEKFKITDQKLLFEIAKIFAKRDGKGISEFIEKFGIISEEDRAKIAMIAAQQDGAGASKYIEKFKITDQELLLEIVKIFAEQDGAKTSEFIEKFGITSKKNRAKIAMIAAQQDGAGTSKYIKNYKITDEEDLIEIFSLAIKTSILDNSIEDILDTYFWSYLPNYNLSEKEFKKIQLLCASCYGIDHIPESSMSKLIHDHTKSSQFPPLAVFGRKITEIEEKISKEQDLYQLEKLKKKRQRALLYFSLVSEKCNDSDVSLTEDQQNYFIKALEYRNRKQSRFLMQVLAQNFEKPDYFSSYQQLVDKKEHLILPMILVNQWLIESPSSRDSCRENIKQITGFLKGGKQRSSLRSAKGFLPNLLQTLVALSHPSNISSEQKIHLLNQCLQSALPIEGKEWEKRGKKALDTVYVLSIMNLLKPMLDAWKDHYTFEKITSLFKAKLQDIFLLDTPIDHFYEKYLKMEEALRVPLALVKYASNLKSNKEASVSQELQRLTTHVLEGSVKQERYRTENNFHLQKMKEEFPKTFTAWQTSPEAIEHKLGETKQQSMDFPAFLKEKILSDNHFPQAPLALRQYLEGKPHPLEDMEKAEQEIVLLCKELCDPLIDFTKKITLLTTLSLLVGQSEFKNDLDSLHKTLTTTRQQKSVLMLDSDDWQDLFLSGTEVLGSCQGIDSSSSFSVCLMAYVLDGKNRILCIKDPATGKILARCIFRLLFKDNQPVLFQERIYPRPCEYEELLNQLAETRARELGLELFTCDTRDNLESSLYDLESLGSCSPYEHVDASKGKTEGVFKIDIAKKVTLSSEDI